jgi:hypothetical protein
LPSLRVLILSQGEQASGLKSFATAFGYAGGAQAVSFSELFLGGSKVMLSRQGDGLKRNYRNVKILGG